MDRRALLTAAGVAALGALTGCADPTSAVGPVTVTRTSTAMRTPVTAAAAHAPARPAPARPVPPRWHQAELTGLKRVHMPKPIVAEVPDVNPNSVALTIDDGVSAETVRGYVDLARATGIRLTFFVNGVYPSWTEHRAELLPLVESGQIQLANHTWDHPYLTKLSDSQVMAEITENEKFLRSTFGVDPRPFFRPPYFARSPRIDALLIDAGYSVITWWTGSFGDASLLTPAQILGNAQQYLTPDKIVIGHANHTPVLSVLPQIEQLIRDRHLRTVTLADVIAG